MGSVEATAAGRHVRRCVGRSAARGESGGGVSGRRGRLALDIGERVADKTFEALACVTCTGTCLTAASTSLVLIVTAEHA
jgi:hypothetical protein